MTLLKLLLLYLATTTIASAIALGVFLLIKGDDE